MNRDLYTKQATLSQKFTYTSFIIVYKDNNANIDFVVCRHAATNGPQMDSVNVCSHLVWAERR